MSVLMLTLLASWGIYALLGIGIVLVYRTSRILNIAGGEMAIFIAYLVAVLIEDGVTFSAAVPLGIVASMALGFIVFWTMIRRIMGEPPYVGLMMTVGLGTIFNGLMIVLFGGGMLAVPTGLAGFIQLDSMRLPSAEIVAAVGA